MVESVGNPRYGIYDRDFFVSLKNSNQLAAPLRAFLAKQEAAVQAGTLGDANAADPARPAGEVSAPTRYRGLVSASIVDQQESIVLQAQSNLLGKVETVVQDLRQQITAANEGKTTGQPTIAEQVTKASTDIDALVRAAANRGNPLASALSADNLGLNNVATASADQALERLQEVETRIGSQREFVDTRTAHVEQRNAARRTAFQNIDSALTALGVNLPQLPNLPGLTGEATMATTPTETEATVEASLQNALATLRGAQTQALMTAFNPLGVPRENVLYLLSE